MEETFRTPYGVSVGSNHSLIIIDGSVYSWGSNVLGQFSSNNNSAIPQKIENLNNVVAVTWSLYHSMAITQNGDVYVWGDNSCGQLGVDTFNSSLTPKKLNITNVCMIACSPDLYSMALTKDGEVYTWGNNFGGQLGNGTTNGSKIPQKISNLTNITAIGCGRQHSVAITKEGFVYSWGNNSYGQLGNGSTTSEMVPQKIPNLANITAIACGYLHVLALTYDGDVYSWGHNTYGQVGDGTTNKALTPQRISTLTNIVAIASGYYHSMAITDDGDVYSWGHNGYGQLGFETTDNTIIPQKINILDVYAIACVGSHSMVLTNHGHLYVWGRNSFGQLGNGTIVDTTTPEELTLPPGTKQWFRPLPLPFPLHPHLNRKLLIHMESLLNTLNLETVACDNHQFHCLSVNHTRFHLHKAMLTVRAPGLLNLKELDISPILFQEITNFIYTNTPLTFENMNFSQIIHLILLCKSINFMDIIPLCHEALTASLTKENVFNAIDECRLLNLTEELDCIAWFVKQNSLTMLGDIMMNLFNKNGSFFVKLLSQVKDPSKPQVRPLEEVMEVLFSTKEYSDFTINFKNTSIRVHKFVLASRWPYFTNIMLRDQSITVHNSPMPLDTFEKLIQFFYVGAKHLTMRDCGWILCLSGFYLLHDEKSLLIYCDQMVNSQIETNWPSALQLSMELDNNEIEQKAISMIPSSIKPQQIVSLCLNFLKEQQRSIQEQQKSIQEQKIMLNNIMSHFTRLESLLNK